MSLDKCMFPLHDKLSHILINLGYICLNTGHTPLWEDRELGTVILILAVKKRTQSSKASV